MLASFETPCSFQIFGSGDAVILKEPAPEGGELVRSLTRPGLTGKAEQWNWQSEHLANQNHTRQTVDGNLVGPFSLPDKFASQSALFRN